MALPEVAGSILDSFLLHARGVGTAALLDDDGGPGQETWAHRDPARRADLYVYPRGRLRGTDANAAVVEALRSGAPVQDKARLYGRQLKVAEALQQSLLTPPPRHPSTSCARSCSPGSPVHPRTTTSPLLALRCA